MTAWIAMIRKDLVLYFSNRRAVLVSVVAPVAIAAFFGYLFSDGTQKPSRIPVAIANQDDSAIARNVVAALLADEALDATTMSEADGIEAVRRGKLRTLVVLPPNMGRQAADALKGAGPKPAVPVYFDPSQAMATAVVKGLLAQTLTRTVAESAFAGALQGERSVPGDATSDASASAVTANAPARFNVPFTTDMQEVTSKVNRHYNSYSHAFAGMSVQFILFMGIELGVGLLLSRREGIWTRLRAAPISRTLLLGSRMASGAIIALTLFALIMAIGVAFFGVRIDGSVLGFAAVGIAFAVLTASFGLLVAALGKSPEATRGLAILATLAMVMLGGAWAPTFIFPAWLQTLSTFVPTRWAIDGFDGMTWRGLGLEAALLPVGVLLAFSAAFALLAMLRFDWDE